MESGLVFFVDAQIMEQLLKLTIKGEKAMGKYKDTPRYNVISMRVSDVERNELQHIASRHDLSISKLMRQAMDIFTRYHDPIVASHRII